MPGITKATTQNDLHGESIEILETPCLTVDLDIMKANISTMAELVSSSGVNLRPHIKTHKSPSIGKLQLESGAVGITAAKLSEAWVFANEGFDDILLAYQVVSDNKIQNLIELAKKVKLRTCVDHLATAQKLSKAALSADIRLEVLLDVDTGLERTGCSPQEALDLGIQISKLQGLNLCGVFSYAGYRPGDPNPDVRRSWARNEAETAASLARSLQSQGVPANTVSVSGTPGAPFAIEVEGVTEVRPGTYVFGDMNYVRLGVLQIENCALKIRSTIISKPSKNRVVIDAGTKVLSSDRPSVIDGPSYGYLPQHPRSNISKAWEEHSVVDLHASDSSLNVGDVLEVIPNHVCVVTNLANYWHYVQNGTIQGLNTIPARGLVE